MSSPIQQIAHNAVTAKLLKPPQSVREEIAALLSYEVEGYQHTDAFKVGGWDGRSNFYTYASDTFPAGFVGVVEKRLRNLGYRVQRVAKQLPGALGPENPKVDDFPVDPRYDYQMETVRKLEKRGQMIARVATGGGKSRIAKLCIARIARPTLFITTRKVLMYQMKESLEASDMKCGVLGDGEWKPDANINVAMVQTLVARLEEPSPRDNSAGAIRQRRIRERTIEELSRYEFLIGEEAHESGSDSYYEMMRHCKNAYYRLALTGTPFMKADGESNMRLMASFGMIGINVSEKLLIDRGILARPIFKFKHTTRPSRLRTGTAFHRAYELGISQNEFRNEDIVEEVKRASRYGLTAMVLVKHKKHGVTLEGMFKRAGLNALFIFGESTNAKRRKALDDLEAGKIDVLIGSVILDVGVDVPAVGMVVLAGGGKAEVAMRQRIGRGLRAKKSGPNVCLVLDYHDEHNKSLRQHSLSRQEIVKATPGFVENLLGRDEDYDMAALGFINQA